jgi:hypothetical protein
MDPGGLSLSLSLSPSLSLSLSLSRSLALSLPLAASRNFRGSAIRTRTPCGKIYYWGCWAFTSLLLLLSFAHVRDSAGIKAPLPMHSLTFLIPLVIDREELVQRSVPTPSSPLPASPLSLIAAMSMQPRSASQPSNIADSGVKIRGMWQRGTRRREWLSSSSCHC